MQRTRQISLHKYFIVCGAIDASLVTGGAEICAVAMWLSKAGLSTLANTASLNKHTACVEDDTEWSPTWAMHISENYYYLHESCGVCWAIKIRH